MIYKITTVEILEDGKPIGHSPVFMVKGQKNKMYLGDDDKPLVFETPKQARVFAMKQELTFK